MSGSDSPTFFHGQPWSNWIERIGRDKPLSDEEPETEPATSVTRLSADDIDLYGFCPERDTFYGVVCEICNAVVKPQALIQHMESRHSSGQVDLPPPSTPTTKAPIKTPYCKVSKITKKSQPSLQSQPSSTGGASGGNGTGNSSTNTKINHGSVKRSAEQSLLTIVTPHSPLETIAVTSTSINTTNIVPSSPIKSPANNGNTASNSSSTSTSGQQRRKRLKGDRGLLKDREYDPDRHCGVWNDETGKPCTRSLTCKAHTVSLRRTVVGRSKSFDKLLSEHRAAKELPNRTSKVTVSGTVTVTTAPVSLGITGTTVNDSDITPSSPPVLSLPDTYPLPKAVDLLYRCLAPHGSNKPTKLEEDFVNEEIRLAASLSTPLTSTASSSTSSKSMMTPISVVLPSLSPITANDGGQVATLIPAGISTTVSVATSNLLPTPQPQLPNTVLEGETPDDVDTTSMSLYSPVSVFKDTKAQLTMQLPRSNNNNILQSSVSASRSFQAQASMPSLMFDEQMDIPKQQLANGKRLNNHTILLSPIGRPMKRSKHDFQTEFSGSLQVEATATTASTHYPHLSDIAWSNCHPEPLAVNRWLRITSSRKQYNFNIH